MEKLRIFRKINNLTQDELGKYLGMKKSFISKIETGKEKLPKDKFQKLLLNEMGWDISMFDEETGVSSVVQKIGDGCSNFTQVVGTSEVYILKERIQFLEKIIEEKERTIQLLINSIKDGTFRQNF